ncbi:hypothetical protein [Telmatospirillum sp.]|uniref:hypothetical protein n=1 Tax=Telmatospirillum sp. TaxID=2079197 RepID=UPI002848E655|nr:hypothetical protein [Telmatospirillum sp.]MDR3440834.1 hypothetical protein [Telmatospirillum sp.]
MKKIILIAVLIVILVIGVIGGLAAFGMGPFPNLIKPFKIGEASSDAPPAAAEVKGRTFDLGTFIIPLVSKHDIGRQVGMDLAIVVTEGAAGRVSSELPRLQNAILVDLYDFVPQHADTHSAADKEAIHQRLIKVSSRLFGDDAIRNVIIKSLYDR